jgi:hypothetical protein
LSGAGKRGLAAQFPAPLKGLFARAVDFWPVHNSYGMRVIGAVTPVRTRGFRQSNACTLGRACPVLSTGV